MVCIIHGIITIKKILSSCQDNCEISYIAAGKYTIKKTSDNYKQAEKEINQVLEKIEQQAKSAKADFEIIEKKK